jgi:hypothetical protein
MLRRQKKGGLYGKDKKWLRSFNVGQLPRVKPVCFVDPDCIILQLISKFKVSTLALKM